MINNGFIYCSKEQAVPLIIGKDSVYIHTDIIQIPIDNLGKQTDNLYQCNEIQYSKDEYIQLLSEKSDALTIAIAEILGV